MIIVLNLKYILLLSLSVVLSVVRVQALLYELTPCGTVSRLYHYCMDLLVTILLYLFGG